MRVFFFPSIRRHTRYGRAWSSDVCSSDLPAHPVEAPQRDVPASDGEGHEPAATDVQEPLPHEIPQTLDVAGVLSQEQRREVLLYQGPDGAATAADRVGVAVTCETLGVQGQRDQLLGVYGAVAGVAHGLQGQTVVGTLDALDLHIGLLDTEL